MLLLYFFVLNHFFRNWFLMSRISYSRCLHWMYLKSARCHLYSIFKNYCVNLLQNLTLFVVLNWVGWKWESLGNTLEYFGKYPWIFVTTRVPKPTIHPIVELIKMSYVWIVLTGCVSLLIKFLSGRVSLLKKLLLKWPCFFAYKVFT